MSFEDWNKYFRQVFEGAWQCYSVSTDASYRQWIEKGTRWAVDFQNRATEESAALKSRIKELESELEVEREVVNYLGGRYE